MKGRIVRELSRMANRKDEQYISYIAREAGMNEADLPAIAGKVLAHLLHDYSHFSVVTIDSFFQKVIRSFAREMGLYAGYNVELDQNSVLDESTNLMLDDIDKNDFLKDWLVDWAKRKIEEGKSWNFKTDMLKLGSEIFSEELQNIEPDLLLETTDKESLERFRLELHQLTDTYTEHLQKIGRNALALMADHHLDVDDFVQKGKGVGGYFRKLAGRQEAVVNSYVAKALDGIEGWCSKSSPRKSDIEQAYHAGLDTALRDAVVFQEEHAREVATTSVILKQINVLGVLCDLMRYVNEYTRDQNLFLLSEASGFLKTIIANADAPFIYERVGNFYNHFMIDEFQDTSSIQWGNFRPLVDNSLASGYANWIVGDVKQSIYRWRNTDWKILSEQVENDLGTSRVSVENLDKNWRSTPEVIHFNNAFFREAVQQMRQAFLCDEGDVAAGDYLEVLADAMTDAYRDAYQHLPPQKATEQGYIHLSIIPGEEDDEETWRDKVLQGLPQRVEQLQDLGYRLSDIAILVRENKEAQLIADMLLTYRQANPDSMYRYDVLSNESLLIGNASVVKWLVAAMQFIVEPYDLINRAYLQHEYETYLKDSDAGTRSLTTVPEKQLHQWRSLPVYELSEKLIRQYELYRNTGQAPFLQAFQDILLQYTRQGATDIRSFLDWWETEKSKKYVTMPDNQDAIRLITIHKSKGLEFDAVIIPFCDWPLCKPGKILWCQPREKPFDDMKLLPLRFEPALRSTIFVKEYLREKMLSYIDNLNLLYVAFTRARKALFISTPQQEKDGFADVKDLIHRVYYQPLAFVSASYRDDIKKYIQLNDFWQPDTLCFEQGILSTAESKTSETCAEPTAYFDQPAKHDWEYVPHITRNSEYFTVGTTNRAQLDKGRLLHDIFRTIITTADLEHCLNALISEGKLSGTERTHITGMVQQALRNPTVSRWFEPGLQVKTETEILLPDGTIARPDRIVFDDTEVHVIDYKFGDVESGKYHRQVLRYMEYLSGMGYPSVKGFLWYVTLNKVEEVK